MVVWNFDFTLEKNLWCYTKLYQTMESLETTITIELWFSMKKTCYLLLVYQTMVILQKLWNFDLLWTNSAAIAKTGTILKYGNLYYTTVYKSFFC